MSRRAVVLSGSRPTGRQHLGNYWGVVRNWIGLSEQYDCYYCLADWHMLTTGYEEVSALQRNILDTILDWLAAGLDPEKCVIFKQSDVPEHAELALLLGMVTPLSWLENNPTWKEQLQELAKTKLSKLQEQGAREERTATAAQQHELRTFGFLGYPVLQAADILLYRGEKVPVGQDQLPHLELSREIARKFNSIFGQVFPEPLPILSETPRLPGTDGRKMSKSYGNAVDIDETSESLQAKVMSMYTDPKKIKATTPGHPDPGPENPPGCVVYALHKLYNPQWAEVGAKCRAGELGCVQDKKDLLGILDKPFSEFRQRRQTYASDPRRVEKILEDGAKKARAVAVETMKEVRRAMRLKA
ncbi:MAG: tryptophan--tRNA ligase [Elusimicrobia bacterium]|nr:tryptophan--tRNA ligase [Elusimicrobiota bacterium]